MILNQMERQSQKDFPTHETVHTQVSTHVNQISKGMTQGRVVLPSPCCTVGSLWASGVAQVTVEPWTEAAVSASSKKHEYMSPSDRLGKPRTSTAI